MLYNNTCICTRTMDTQREFFFSKNLKLLGLGRHFWLKCFEAFGVFSAGLSAHILVLCTPFENPQRWMGKNTFHFLLLNDDNMIGEHQETSIEMPDMCTFEKKRKKKVGSLKKLLFLFSQKDTYLAFQFLFPSVLLSCYHHLKAKLGMYFCPSIFEHFRMV